MWGRSSVCRHLLVRRGELRCQDVQLQRHTLPALAQTATYTTHPFPEFLQRTQATHCNLHAKLLSLVHHYKHAKPGPMQQGAERAASRILHSASGAKDVPHHLGQFQQLLKSQTSSSSSALSANGRPLWHGQLRFYSSPDGASRGPSGAAGHAAAGAGAAAAAGPAGAGPAAGSAAGSAGAAEAASGTRGTAPGAGGGGAAAGGAAAAAALAERRRRLTEDSQRAGAARSHSGLLYLSALVVAMVGATYAAVPLYRMFCQATGYGGTVQKRETVEEKIAKHTQAGGSGSSPAATAASQRELVVQFNADVADNMPWRFLPSQREIVVRPGDSTLAFYTAHNLSDQPITGVSTYNVSPMRAGIYFNKIQCFCFEEQRLRPGEKLDMPVFFYIDPEFATDPKMADISSLTLSYTFFRVEDDEEKEEAA